MQQPNLFSGCIVAKTRKTKKAAAVKKRYRDYAEEKTRLKVRRSTSIATIATAFKLSIPNEEGFCWGK